MIIRKSFLSMKFSVALKKQNFQKKSKILTYCIFGVRFLEENHHFQILKYRENTAKNMRFCWFQTCYIWCFWRSFQPKKWNYQNFTSNLNSHIWWFWQHFENIFVFFIQSNVIHSVFLRRISPKKVKMSNFSIQTEFLHMEIFTYFATETFFYHSLRIDTYGDLDIILSKHWIMNIKYIRYVYSCVTSVLQRWFFSRCETCAFHHFLLQRSTSVNNPPMHGVFSVS